MSRPSNLKPSRTHSTGAWQEAGPDLASLCPGTIMPQWIWMEGTSQHPGYDIAEGILAEEIAHAGASIPMGQGRYVPQYLWRGTSMVMLPQCFRLMSFRLGLFYPVTATTVVCCILMQALCLVSQKSFSFWGTSAPRPPTGARLLDPAGDFRSQTPSLLLCPPIILWDRRPWAHELLLLNIITELCSIS